jgi:hypothetical protein
MFMSGDLTGSFPEVCRIILQMRMSGITLQMRMITGKRDLDIMTKTITEAVGTFRTR